MRQLELLDVSLVIFPRQQQRLLALLHEGFVVVESLLHERLELRALRPHLGSRGFNQLRRSLLHAAEFRLVKLLQLLNRLPLLHRSLLQRVDLVLRSLGQRDGHLALVLRHRQENLLLHLSFEPGLIGVRVHPGLIL